MSLYHKYRPNSLDGYFGNEDLKEKIGNMLENKQTCPHVFLFWGGTGCGKTTLARIVAEKLGCKGIDLKEMDSSSFRGIDTIREIRNNCQYKPIESVCRVYIMDEVHKLTNDAQNAFLKILEDTPAHVYFILCTTEPQKLLETVKKRCSEFQVKPLAEKTMIKLLHRVVKSEDETLEREVYEQIISDSKGHPRNALQILEQVLNVAPEKRLQAATQYAEEVSQSIELCRALMKNESWKRVQAILRGLKDQEAESIRRHVLGYCESVLLKEDNEWAARIMEEFIEPFYNSGFSGVVYASYSLIKNK